MRQCWHTLRGALLGRHLPGALALMLMRLIGCQAQPRTDDANRVAIATAVITDFLIAPAQRVLRANIRIEFRTVDDSFLGNAHPPRRLVYGGHRAADQTGYLPRRSFSVQFTDDFQLAGRQRRVTIGVSPGSAESLDCSGAAPKLLRHLRVAECLKVRFHVSDLAGRPPPRLFCTLFHAQALPETLPR